MFERFLELDVAIVDLSSVVIFAEVADFFSEFFKIMLALHHLHLMALFLQAFPAGFF